MALTPPEPQDSPWQMLSPLPQDFTPFARDRVAPCDIRWVHSPDRDLFPPPLDLAHLEAPALQLLRTGFAARSSPAPGKSPSKRSPPSRSRRSPRPPDGDQLSLWDGFEP